MDSKVVTKEAQSRSLLIYWDFRLPSMSCTALSLSKCRSVEQTDQRMPVPELVEGRRVDESLP